MRILPCLGLAALVACTSDEEKFDDTGFADDTGEETCAEITAYDYNNQAAWADDNPACAGSSQSPIDLVMSEIVPQSIGLEFEYTTTPLSVVNNGHSVEFEVDSSASTLLVDGAAYPLQQFHFHSPSEHTFDGEHTDMEMHLVHKDSAGKFVVVAIFIRLGETEQAWLKAAEWSALPADPGECLEDDGVSLDLADLIENQLIGEEPSAGHYTGSLTTPPCTEGVEWFIMAPFLEVSQSQLDGFSDIYFGNNRDTQPIGDREVGYDADYAP